MSRSSRDSFSVLTRFFAYYYCRGTSRQMRFLQRPDLERALTSAGSTLPPRRVQRPARRHAEPGRAVRSGPSRAGGGPGAPGPPSAPHRAPRCKGRRRAAPWPGTRGALGTRCGRSASAVSAAQLCGSSPRRAPLGSPSALTLGSDAGPRGPVPPGALQGGLCRGKGSSHPAGSEVSEVTQGPGSNSLSSVGPGAPPAQADQNFPPAGVPHPLSPQLLPGAGRPRPL